MSVSVTLKHSGKLHPLQFDPSQKGAWLKQKAYDLTGVPSNKVKIVVKGGMLKDDADLSKLGIKEGHTFMVIGTAGELPKAPLQPIVFMEDMTDTQLAEAVKTPGGLQNLGNTCYMNSCIQVLRSIPELQVALEQYPGRMGDASRGTAGSLTAGLRDLYKDLGKTAEGYPPMLFWQVLRQHVPQFQEMREGHPAQQDAQECWIQVVQALKQNLDEVAAPIASSSSSTGLTDAAQATKSKFVQRFMVGEQKSTMTCAEAPEEESTTTTDAFDYLQCHISGSTNYLTNGLKESLNDSIEKTSPTLGRTAVYQKETKITRMPQYLTVVLQRFFWRSDLRKKVKIMRQVKFTFDLDLSEMLDEPLAKRVLPVNRRFKEIEKDRRERAKVARRTKMAAEEAAREAAAPGSQAAANGQSNGMVVDGGEKKPEEEGTARQKEMAELQALIDPELKTDIGSNPTGIYQCAVARVLAAVDDGGHYIGWVRANTKVSTQADQDPDKEEWYKFDDDKVSTVTRDKISSLAGGGEDSAAYVLLYRAMDL